MCYSRLTSATANTPSLLLQVFNPATGKPIATMPRMRTDETRAAIAAAHSVFPQWRAKTAKERAAILRK